MKRLIGFLILTTLIFILMLYVKTTIQNFIKMTEKKKNSHTKYAIKIFVPKK